MISILTGASLLLGGFFLLARRQLRAGLISKPPACSAIDEWIRHDSALVSLNPTPSV
jgi:hypothetical protein